MSAPAPAPRARTVVTQVLAGPRLLRAEWLCTQYREAVPFQAGAPIGPGLAGRLAAAAGVGEAEELLVCPTQADRLDEPVSRLPVDAARLYDGLRRLGATDVLIAVPDLSAVLLPTVAGFAVAAGPRWFVEGVLGGSVARAKRDFAELALARRDEAAHLFEVAAYHGCPLSDRAWWPAWLAWSEPVEVPADSAIGVQLAAMRRFAAGQLGVDGFAQVFLDARRREMALGERAVGGLAAALDRAYWALDGYVPAGESTTGLPGRLDAAGLAAAVRTALDGL